MKKFRVIAGSILFILIVCGLRIYDLKRDLDKNGVKTSKEFTFDVNDVPEPIADFKNDWKNIWNLEDVRAGALNKENGMEDYVLLLDDNTLISIRGVFLVGKTRFAVIEMTNAGNIEKKKLSINDCIDSICIKNIVPGSVEFKDKNGTIKILKIFKENK